MPSLRARPTGVAASRWKSCSVRSPGRSASVPNGWPADRVRSGGERLRNLWYLADVFVLPAHRGHGYAKQLIAAVMAEPRLQGLRRFMLMTADAHGLYASLGFQPLAKPGNAMEIARPDLYLSSARRFRNHEPTCIHVGTFTGAGLARHPQSAAGIGTAVFSITCARTCPVSRSRWSTTAPARSAAKRCAANRATCSMCTWTRCRIRHIGRRTRMCCG